MAGTRNPFGRRPHPGSRIHLRKGHGRPACFPIQKTVAKRNLGNAARKSTLAANDNRREISGVSRLPANSGGVLTKTPPTEAPNHRLRPPAPPFLPPSGPANGSFNGHHPKSKLLAAKVSHEPSIGIKPPCWFSWVYWMRAGCLWRVARAPPKCAMPAYRRTSSFSAPHRSNRTLNKNKPMENFLVSRADWSSDSRVYWPAPAHLWNGVVDGESFGTGVTVLFYSTEEVD